MPRRPGQAMSMALSLGWIMNSRRRPLRGRRQGEHRPPRSRPRGADGADLSCMKPVTARTQVSSSSKGTGIVGPIAGVHRCGTCSNKRAARRVCRSRRHRPHALRGSVIRDR
jgi:hypothetical protein